jgi:L-ribulokinase
VDIHAAAAEMGRLSDEVVTPIAENKAAYDMLFAEYKLLYDYFGRGANDAMKRLKALKRQVKKKKLGG